MKTDCFVWVTDQALKEVHKEAAGKNRFTSPVSRWMISKACCTICIVINFFPLLRPCIIREFVRRSTIGHYKYNQKSKRFILNGTLDTQTTTDKEYST